MTRYDPGRAGRSGNKSEQSSNPKASEGLYKIILSTHYLVVSGLFPPFHLFNSSALSYFSLLDCKKSPPIIPGISSTPGTMIYAGSIGTQIANELLDFNRYVLDIITLKIHKSASASMLWLLGVVVDDVDPVVLSYSVWVSFRTNSSPSSGNVSPFSLPQDKSPQIHNQISNSVSHAGCLFNQLA